MKKHWPSIVIALIAAFTCFYATSRAQQPAPADFSHIQIISYASGPTGFFDSQTGMLYVYDGGLDKCVFIRKINKLGDPLQILRNPQLGGQRPSSN